MCVEVIYRGSVGVCCGKFCILFDFAQYFSLFLRNFVWNFSNKKRLELVIRHIII